MKNVEIPVFFFSSYSSEFNGKGSPVPDDWIFFSFPSSNCYSYLYEFFFSRPFSLSPIIYSLRSNSSRWTVKNLWIFRCIGHHGHWHPSISNMMAFSHYCVQRIGPEARWTMDRLFDVSLRFRRYRKIHSLEIRFFFSQKRWTAWNKEKGKKQWKLMNAWVQFHG